MIAFQSLPSPSTNRKFQVQSPLMRLGSIGRAKNKEALLNGTTLRMDDVCCCSSRMFHSNPRPSKVVKMLPTCSVSNISWKERNRELGGPVGVCFCVMNHFCIRMWDTSSKAWMSSRSVSSLYIFLVVVRTSIREMWSTKSSQRKMRWVVWSSAVILTNEFLSQQKNKQLQCLCTKIDRNCCQRYKSNTNTN